MNRGKRIVLIDDDPINNYLNKMIINTINSDASIISFTDPLEGFEYVRTARPFHNNSKTLLFIDINMPGMTGWDFIERFEQLPSETQGIYESYILSSSVNAFNKQRASTHPSIRGYIEKPLPDTLLESIFA
jgi:CheY-like chemotaxis protein